jgi:hypothetical protein
MTNEELKKMVKEGMKENAEDAKKQDRPPK